MANREYIEVHYDTFLAAKALLKEAEEEHIDIEFLSNVQLELIDADQEPERYRAQKDIHNLCLFMAHEEPGWLIVISDQPQGTTIDWVFGH